MGKSRGKSHKQPRNNPTGLAAVSQSHDNGELNLPTMAGGKGQMLSPETIKALSQQLQSASVEDRDCVTCSSKTFQPFQFVTSHNSRLAMLWLD